MGWDEVGWDGGREWLSLGGKLRLDMQLEGWLVE